MQIKIDVFCLGFKMSNPSIVLWGCLLIATTDDGRVKKKITIKELDSGVTKNASDLISAALAMKCIKPVYRSTTAVVLHAPPGYVTQMLEKTADGLWQFTPKSNQREVEALRIMVNTYSRLTVIRAIPTVDKPFRELLDLLQVRVKEAKHDMAGDKGTD